MFSVEPSAPITSLPCVLAALARLMVPAESACRVPVPVRPVVIDSVPFCARMVPLLMTPPFTATLMVPPASALMVPLFVKVVAPPWKLCSPMTPDWPRTVTPDPRVSEPLPSMFSRLLPEASANTMLPVPPMVCVPSDAKMLFWPILIVPFSVMPPADMRSMPVAAAMSSTPLSVTPLR